MRGIATGILTLIVLQTLGSSRGADQGGKLLVWLSQGVNKALNPKLAGIPTVKTAPPKKAPAVKPNEIALPVAPGRGAVTT